MLPLHLHHVDTPAALVPRAASQLSTRDAPNVSIPGQEGAGFQGPLLSKKFELNVDTNTLRFLVTPIKVHIWLGPYGGHRSFAAHVKTALPCHG